MATILLTGATGTVGSVLVPFLLDRGHKLILVVRTKDGKDPATRLREILGEAAENVIVLEGDITLLHLGISETDRSEWKGKINKVFNCASRTKFGDDDTCITTLTNVDGTRNVLRFAKEMGIPEVHHVSTAYIAGDAQFFSEDQFDVGQDWWNVYESTKFEAEGLVRTWRHGRYSVYRLGIVVGDSVTGYISQFNGYYGFLANIWYLRRTIIALPKEELVRKYGAGIGFDENGILTLPIIGNFSTSSTLNIVPVDWICRSLADLVEIPASGQIFHVVHPNPPNIRWLNEVSLACLGVKGFRYGISDRYNSGKLQKLFDRGTAMYIPYITHEAEFKVSNMPLVLGEKYCPPPIVDAPFVERILEYPKSVNFGKK